MSGPETSIVIRTFNEEKYLPALLEAISGQTYRDFETIVVDSGSVDRTRDIARRACDRLCTIDSAHFTFGYSLNHGIRESQGRYIAVVSAHARPVDGDWLGRLINPLRAGGAVMVYGRQLGGSSSNFAEVQDFRRTFGPRWEVLRPPRFFANNANSAIGRDFWERYPFHEALPGLEDVDWAKYWMARGFEVIYEPAAAVYHIHEESWSQVRHRYYREAVAWRRLGLRTRRQIPLEVLREAGRLGADLVLAAREGSLLRHTPQVAGFRYHKLVGMVHGLVDGAALANAEDRESVFFDKTCRAVVIRSRGCAALEEVPIPHVRPGDVLIRVAYEGVCGTDLEVLAGTLGYYRSGVAHYPIVPGHELSGRVVKIGANVQHLAEGDPVVVECIQSCGDCPECRRERWIACAGRKELGVIGLNGGYSQYLVVPGRFVHALPASLDLRKAALCEPLAVAIKGVTRLERAAGAAERMGCLVVGAGPIGHLTALVLAHWGHHVTAYDRNPLRLSYLEGTGVATTGTLEAVSSYDALVEATGDPASLEDLLHRSQPGARILLLGLPYARREFSFEGIVAQDRTVTGSVGSSVRDFKEAMALLPRLELQHFTSTIYPLERFSQAWDAARSGQPLKVLLQVDPD